MIYCEQNKDEEVTSGLDGRQRILIVGEKKIVKAMHAVGLTRGVPIKLRGMMQIAIDRSSVQIVPLSVSSQEAE